MSADATEAQPEWGFLGRSVLVVSPFPPKRDGIGRYTDQLLAVLGDRRFIRLGIPGGGGEHVRALSGWFRPLWILAHARGMDDVVVMYHPTYFHRGGAANRLVSHVSLWVVSRLTRATFVIHEPDLTRAAEIGRRGKLEFYVLEHVRRRMWASVSALVFHTDWERRRFAQRFPGSRRRIERLVTHGSFFSSRVESSRSEARGTLGLPSHAVILLLIGFLSPHKQYERVIDALERERLANVELHIVGSPITDWPEVMRYVLQLRARADHTPFVHMHERFVGDDEFDLWIRAADAVVVPYESASSSGVVARTHLIGTTLITSGAGGISDQLLPSDLRFASAAELVAAVEEVARLAGQQEVGLSGG